MAANLPASWPALHLQASRDPETQTLGYIHHYEYTTLVLQFFTKVPGK